MEYKENLRAMIDTLNKEDVELRKKIQREKAILENDEKNLKDIWNKRNALEELLN